MTLAFKAADRDVQVRARYVVGCDGAHSAVRELTGIPFDGETCPQSFVLADVDMAWPLSRNEVRLFFSPEGLVVVAPLPGERRYRIVATVGEAPPEPSLADVQALLDARGPRRPRPRIDAVIGRPGSASTIAWPRAIDPAPPACAATPPTSTARPAARA